MRVEYASNNSGGSWWLKDEHWHALAKAGWQVVWAVNGDAYYDGPPPAESDGSRYMGALAKRAFLDCETPVDAIRSFEKATGMEASDEGCNCCGPPHRFSWSEPGNGYGSASGEDILPLLYGDGPKSLREACEALKKGTP